MSNRNSPFRKSVQLFFMPIILDLMAFSYPDSVPGSECIQFKQNTFSSNPCKEHLRLLQMISIMHECLCKRSSHVRHEYDITNMRINLSPDQINISLHSVLNHQYIYRTSRARDTLSDCLKANPISSLSLSPSETIPNETGQTLHSACQFCPTQSARIRRIHAAA